MSGGQELCAKLQCRSDGADESAEVASEMVKHLKKLTQNVRELETSIHAIDAAQATSSHADHGSSLRNRTENTTSDRHCFAGQVYNTFPQDPAFWENYPLSSLGHGQDPPSVSLSSVSDHNLSEIPSAARHSDLFRNGIANWITWKWRWAASSARCVMTFSHVSQTFNNKLAICLETSLMAFSCDCLQQHGLTSRINVIVIAVDFSLAFRIGCFS